MKNLNERTDKKMLLPIFKVGPILVENGVSNDVHGYLINNLGFSKVTLRTLKRQVCLALQAKL